MDVPRSLRAFGRNQPAQAAAIAASLAIGFASVTWPVKFRLDAPPAVWVSAALHLAGALTQLLVTVPVAVDAARGRSTPLARIVPGPRVWATSVLSFLPVVATVGVVGPLAFRFLSPDRALVTVISAMLAVSLATLRLSLAAFLAQDRGLAPLAALRATRSCSWFEVFWVVLLVGVVSRGVGLALPEGPAFQVLLFVASGAWAQHLLAQVVTDAG